MRNTSELKYIAIVVFVTSALFVGYNNMLINKMLEQKTVHKQFRDSLNLEIEFLKANSAIIKKKSYVIK